MKHLNNMGLLEDSVETISMMDLRQQPGEILTQVALGKRFIITKNGKPIAEIQKIEPSALELGAAIRKSGLDR